MLPTAHLFSANSTQPKIRRDGEGYELGRKDVVVLESILQSVLRLRSRRMRFQRFLVDREAAGFPLLLTLRLFCTDRELAVPLYC